MDFPTEQETAEYFLDMFSDYRLERLVRSYCYKNDIDYRVLINGSQKQNYVQARHEISQIAKDKDFSLSQIGNALNRDHSTIIHYLEERAPIS